MAYTGIIFIFIIYIILEAVIIQIIHMLTKCKVRNKVYAFCAICIFSLINCIMINSPKLELPGAVLVVIAAFLAVKRLFLYACVFRKLKLDVIYFFLVVTATNQIYVNIVKQFVSNVNYRSAFAYFMEAVILSAFMLHTKRNNKDKMYRQILDSLHVKLYVLVLVMLLIASVFVMAATRNDTEDVIQYFLLPSMIGLLISTMFVLKIGISEAEKKANIDILSRQMESQVGYYEKINRIYGEFRSFRHDYRNHVLCLRGLIAADKKEEAIKYMETMQDMSSLGKNMYNTGNVIIDVLLDDKAEKAEKVNARLVFEGIGPHSGISSADLCIIMANAIDNAIEACSKDTSSDEKIINVLSYVKQGYFFFRVSNPMFEEVKFKGKNKVATSKLDKEHHGFGISNIIHTAKKYGGDVEISIDRGNFIIDVQLLLEQETVSE